MSRKFDHLSQANLSMYSTNGRHQLTYRNQPKEEQRYWFSFFPLSTGGSKGSHFYSEQKMSIMKKHYCSWHVQEDWVYTGHDFPVVWQLSHMAQSQNCTQRNPNPSSLWGWRAKAVWQYQERLRDPAFLEGLDPQPQKGCLKSSSTSSSFLPLVSGTKATQKMSPNTEMPANSQ